MELNQIICGDSKEVLKTFPDNFVDAIVTDPPAGISFMGKEFDSDRGGRDNWIAWLKEIMAEALRVLKPGGHALVWALPRTSHWTATALEDAGFEIRDCVYHLFGSGFPKSLDISKAIDKQAGAEREIIGKNPSYRKMQENPGNYNLQRNENLTEPKTPEAKQWEGWGSALKPAVECWWLCRKPLSEPTIAQNVLKWGTGGLNIDGSRVEYQSEEDKLEGQSARPSLTKDTMFPIGGFDRSNRNEIKGRFPANLIHDGSDVVLAEFAKAGESKSNASDYDWNFAKQGNVPITKNIKSGVHFDDEGSPARFFASLPPDEPARFLYTAKPSSSEKNLMYDDTLTVKYNNPICEENIVAVQLLKKVILDSAQLNLSIDESGENIMAQCQLAFLSTIKTTISKIIESKILNSLTHSLINESIADVNSEKANGGNLAENVESLKKWILTTTNGNQELVLGANNVAVIMLNLMSKDAEWKSLTNSHPTPKAQSLMQYLIKLICPPKGIVLDCFAGSCSTLLAAKSLGHSFIGIEINEEYCKIGRARLAQGTLNF